MAFDEPWHGSSSGYGYHKCRCDMCSQYVREQRGKRIAHGLPDGDPRHGTLNGYRNWGCRCTPCADAESRNRRNKS